MHRIPNLLAIGAAALLLACAGPGPAAETPSPAESPQPDPRSFVVCKDPRPTVCTREMRPVCAHTMEGDLVDRPNGCNACADRAILGHRLGTCR